MNRVAFITEAEGTNDGFRNVKDIVRDTGVTDLRTDIAWMYALNADLYSLLDDFEIIKGYDYVIIIWPKGETTLNAVGVDMQPEVDNPLGPYLHEDGLETLKRNNHKVCYMQEGPVWFFNDYSIPDQIRFYNIIMESDIIFCHNKCDINWYTGLFPNKDVRVMPTLMIDDYIPQIDVEKEDKVIIGGNFAKWYGGFQSYVIADQFECPKWIPSMHNRREYEDSLEDLNHLPYLNWLDWIKILATFKYAVHMMPTVAAGTFSLNCAYLGIPCIGNERLDTQRHCFPDLSVDVEDINSATKLARRLKEDTDFYNYCSNLANENYKQYEVNNFTKKFFETVDYEKSI